MGKILRKKIKIQRSIIFNSSGHLYPEFLKHVKAWLKDGKIKYCEDLKRKTLVRHDVIARSQFSGYFNETQPLNILSHSEQFKKSGSNV